MNIFLRIKKIFRANFKSEILKLFLNERKLRINASKRLEKRLKKIYGNCFNEILELETKINKFNKNLLSLNIEAVKNDLNENKKLFKSYDEHRKNMYLIDDLVKKLGNYNKDFEYLSSLSLNAEKTYKKYSKKLEKEISDLELKHAFIRRLASVEERITMIEINNNK